MVPQPLTPRQREVLAFVDRHCREQGMPPTVREIGRALGIASPNAVSEHLDALVRKGALIRSPHRSRGIIPVEGAANDRDIPILGRIAAGRPVFAQENLDGYLELNASFFGQSTADTFGLRVVGDSMIGDGILPGDLLVVRRQGSADPGQIVVALVEDEATVKHYHPETDHVRLVASNPAHAPIRVDPTQQSFALLGIVVGVCRRL